ncbi:uncharacterized protein ASCRUDRAFT_27122, partial [Ascoidea rubescens DSM 1968]
MKSNIWIAAADNEIEQVLQYLNSGQYTANSKDENGYTPIHASVSYNNIELLRLLINKYNGDINIQDNDGDTPLHHVEELSMAKVVVEEFHANLGTKNNEGLSPVEYIENEMEYPEIVDYLRSLGDQSQQGSSPGSSEMAASEQQLVNEMASQVRYSFEHMEDANMSSEQRQQLEAILLSEHPEEQLRQHIQGLVH